MKMVGCEETLIELFYLWLYTKMIYGYLSKLFLWPAGQHIGRQLPETDLKIKHVTFLSATNARFLFKGHVFVQ